MGVKIIKGKWDFSGISNLPTAIDLFINCHRVAEPKRLHSRIDKKHNYKFKTR